MKQNRLMLEAAINTPNGNEYSKDEHIAISRRTKYISHDGVVLTRRNYSVSGIIGLTQKEEKICQTKTKRK